MRLSCSLPSTPPALPPGSTSGTGSGWAGLEGEGRAPCAAQPSATLLGRVAAGGETCQASMVGVAAAELLPFTSKLWGWVCDISQEGMSAGGSCNPAFPPASPSGAAAGTCLGGGRRAEPGRLPCSSLYCGLVWWCRAGTCAGRCRLLSGLLPLSLVELGPRPCPAPATNTSMSGNAVVEAAWDRGRLLGSWGGGCHMAMPLLLLFVSGGWSADLLPSVRAEALIGVAGCTAGRRLLLRGTPELRRPLSNAGPACRLSLFRAGSRPVLACS